MSEIGKDNLRDILAKKATALHDEAIEREGVVTEEQVKELERLARLVEAYASTQAPKPRKRGPMVAIFGVTFAIVSLLLFGRCSETEVELDLVLSEVSFRLSKKQVLSDALMLSKVGVSGVREARLPRTRETLRDAEISISIPTPAAGEQRGTITLQSLVLPAGTEVTLSRTRDAHQVRLSLLGDLPDLHASVTGPVEVGSTRREARQVNYERPRAITFFLDSTEVDLELTFPEVPRVAFSPQFSIEKLSLTRVEKYPGQELPAPRRVSTILQGSVYFESLNGEQYQLRPGEDIRFEVSEGTVRTLILIDETIILKFNGFVRGMSSGGSVSRRSLMPTYLAWLRARQGLALLWGTAMYLSGLIISFLRWWRIAT